ncbi:TonB-dependent receptor family protein [Leptospira kmetyi]|uniref:Ligand-gated channel protein n=1 Tax=Leptospira kmetyi TaxID=408139 RepID=A0A5F1XRN8_9LEPT|nr:TonB-dependent receptor [Leptospira kmetyi]AYV55457.1 ligand-gated channel protein [Leptospira kmetyi]EQA51969.1 TonB-dependent receptor [Leptospira kmetyi serovar Malaysia str. Bejo-Iso9]TGK16746.1 ligand-gated channel protein [Leptospira kmetyi]TGK30854.1 ligand-gated channel protein [Leptospira kmetyi]
MKQKSILSLSILILFLFSWGVPAQPEENPSVDKDKQTPNGQGQQPVPTTTNGDDSEKEKWSKGTISVIGKRKTDLKRIPGSATVIEKEFLDQVKPVDSMEVLRRVPGASIRYQDTGLILNIGFRGVNNDLGRKVLILEDGIFTSLNPYSAPEQYYTPNIDRMERIEVVKGSGAILFGPSTIGGVINFITKRPPKEPVLSVSTQGGSYGFFASQISYGGTFGNTGIDISVLRKQGDGFRDHQDFRLHEFSFKSVTDLNDKHTLTSKFLGTVQNANMTYLGLTTAQFWNNSSSNFAEQDNRQLQRYSGDLGHEWKLTDNSKLVTKVYAAYTERNWARQNYVRNTGSYYSNYPGNVIKAYDTEPFVNRPGDTVYMLDSVGHRNRSYRFVGAESRYQLDYQFFGIKNQLDAGLRYHYETADIKYLDGPSTPDYAVFGNGLGNPPTGTASSEYSLAKSGNLRDHEVNNTKSVAGFAQNSFKFYDKFSVIPGVRYETFTQNRTILRQQAIDPATNQPDPNAPSQEVDKGSRHVYHVVIPGLGLTYDIRKDLTWFAGAHKGFSPPRYQDALNNSGVINKIDPEYSYNYETGIRGDITNYLNAQVTYFDLNYINQIIITSSTSGNDSASSAKNGGRTYSRGLETNVTFDPAKLFDASFKLPIDLIYTRADAKMNQYSIDTSKVTANQSLLDFIVTQKDKNGNYVPYVSRDTATLAIGFVHQKGFYARAEYQYFSAQYHDDANTRTVYWADSITDPLGKKVLQYMNITSDSSGETGVIPAYSLINASLGYKHPVKRWSVFLTGKNLADVRYISGRLPEGIQVGPFRQINVGVTFEL